MDAQKLVLDLIRWGWTQQQIAAEIGCSQGAISNLARGLTQCGTYKVVRGVELLHKAQRGRKKVA